jgi:hypothetical protein
LAISPRHSISPASARRTRRLIYAEPAQRLDPKPRQVKKIPGQQARHPGRDHLVKRGRHHPGINRRHHPVLDGRLHRNRQGYLVRGQRSGMPLHRGRGGRSFELRVPRLRAGRAWSAAAILA